MRIIRLITAGILLAAVASFGQTTKRFQLTLFGGLNHVFAYGAAGDYALGSNDFPVTPGHTPLAFGAAFSLRLGDRLEIELRGDYTLSSTLALSDPSDGDTVSISSAKHMAGSLNVLWTLFDAGLRPYLVVGGGMDKLVGDAFTVQSGLGYDVTFLAPTKTLSFFANAGGGVRLPLTASLAAQIDVRYRLIFSKPHSVNGFFATAGLGWRF